MPKRVSLKGKGADLFFGEFPAVDQDDGAEPEADQQIAETPRLQDSATMHAPASELSSAVDATPAARARNPRTAQSVDAVVSVDANAVEAIRQVIKVPGREVSYVRMTPEEKAQLSDIVYTYKRQGQKTSENELNRIAINYLLLDYHEHGEQSVLARVLAALLA